MSIGVDFTEVATTVTESFPERNTSSELWLVDDFELWCLDDELLELWWLEDILDDTLLSDLSLEVVKDGVFPDEVANPDLDVLVVDRKVLLWRIGFRTFFGGGV